MKKNGYTLIELIVLIIGLGIVTFFTVIKLSSAFDFNKDELYERTLSRCLMQAELYGETKKDEIKESESYIITVKDLVDNGFLVTDNGEVVDQRDNSSMLNVRIKLYYNSEEDKVYAEII